ncbi:MAG: ATP-binding protein [Pseudanabaenaceae cyanobacterium]|jgi:signal transduction histidine kinase/CheY-like chemotaxis protein
MSKSLSRQLLLGFSLSLAVVGLTTLWLNYRAVEEDLEQQSKSRAQSIARSLEFATEGLLEFGNQSILERMVQNFATLPIVSKVSIINPEGKIIADNKTFGMEANYTFKTPEIRQAITKSANSGTETYLRTRIRNRAVILYIVPFASRLFHDGDGKRGVIVIALDLEQIQRDAWRIFMISTQTMFLGTVVILAFMGILLQRIILKPLEKLNLAISESHQTGEIKLPSHLPDNEISFLADTLIQAVYQLRHYEKTKNEELRIINSELENLSASLEQKVLERTRELTLANQELEAAKESALASSRAKTAFFANMSHELRTPLNAVLGFTQLVLYAPDTPEVIKEQLDIVNRSGEHLLSLINTVLEMAKIESGKQGLNNRDFDLSVLLNTVREIITHRAQEKNLELVFDLGMNLRESLHGDEMKLKQVLVNLLHNAIKFTERGTVTLKVRLEENVDSTDTEAIITRLYFAVEDTGIGIKPEDTERIFEDFFRSGNGFGQEGTGLGLAITKKFVNLMGGEITVKSTLKQGSIFEFFIPIALAFNEIKTESNNSSDQDLLNQNLADQNIHPLPVDDSSHTITNNPFATNTQTNILGCSLGVEDITKPMSILLAEDNLVNQKLMLKMLSRLGYNADIAVNGIEVLEALRHKRYDLILMDIQMPLMDGLSATIQINQEWDASERPVIIAVTANVMEEDRKSYLAAGMKDYIAKPISITLLQSVLQRLYSKDLEQDR